MRDVDYNLVKLLLAKMDAAWRLENYYLRDAETNDPQSLSTLQKILADEQQHIELIRQELARRDSEKKN